MFSKNISTSLEVIWNGSADTKDTDNTHHNLKKSHDIDQVLSDLRNTNPSNLNFCFLNINSVRNKFTDFLEIINGNNGIMDVVSIVETKINASFPSAQFFFVGYHSPYRLDISRKSGDILVYLKSSILSLCLSCENLRDS